MLRRVTKTKKTRVRGQDFNLFRNLIRQKLQDKKLIVKDELISTDSLFLVLWKNKQTNFRTKMNLFQNFNSFLYFFEIKSYFFFSKMERKRTKKIFSFKTILLVE